MNNGVESIGKIKEVLLHELEWVGTVMKARLETFNKGEKLGKFPLPPPLTTDTAYGRFVTDHDLDLNERFVLALALVPHISPAFLDNLISNALPKAGDFPQLGGVRGNNFRGFLPTGETVLFLLAGDNLEKRFKLQYLFSPEHQFVRKKVLGLEEVPAGEPVMSGKLMLAQEYVELFTMGQALPPLFSLRFPAKRIETEMDWEDLVLNPFTLKQIRELETWIKHGDTLLQGWGMHKRIKPGYRALFHGPPGTGKTLTASLLGKYTGKPVYRIDLSMVVSKFIGETEKNLGSLFAKAEDKDWVLFFDEADALFGKRTNVRDAHDKYANQEVAYLLQRVEDYNGLVILATNLKSNIDDAFLRRFQSIIHFPLPKTGERLRLWQMSFPEQVELGQDVDLNAIAREYELSGSNIVNIIQYLCLTILGEGKTAIDRTLIQKAIKREFSKEGRIL